MGQDVPLPTELADTQVLIAGQPVPLQFVSEGQINAIIPYDIPVNTQQQVVIRRGLTITVPEPVTIAPAQPAVFTVDSTGKGQGIVVDTSFRVVNAGNPAAEGDALIVLCTGLGEVAPPVAAGSPGPSDPLAVTATPVQATLGGVPAAVGFSGLAPGLIGIYQVNLTVPGGIPPGDQVPVILTIGDRASPPVTVSIR